MIVSQTYSNLVNGVSQQAQPLRLAGQCEQQINAVASIVQGLKKRPPSQHLAKLNASTWVKPKIHTINRDAQEQYIVALINGDIFVWDVLGNAKTVTFPDGKDYLDVVGNPCDQFHLQSIADTTFVVNREVVTAMSTSKSPVQHPVALIWIKEGVNGQDYTVVLNSTSATHTTSATAAVKTTDIVSALITAINTALGGASTDWSIVGADSIIVISRVDHADFTIDVSDSFANEAMQLVKDEVQIFGDLPAYAPDGFVVEIRGDTTTNADNYWVKFTATNSGTTGPGIWSETVAPNINISFDTTTMPWILQRQSDGTFQFKKESWTDRLVGDATTVPQPSFVGNTINDVFLFRGRLGFLSDENVILSEAGNDLNFWKTTAVTLVDSDPIDIENGSANVAIFYSAIPFNDKLILFSQESQHTLTGGLTANGDVLSNVTARLTLSTQYDALTVPRPINVGSSIYFPYDRGDFSGVREYFVSDQSGANNSADITAHVPTYIEGTIYSLSANMSEEFCVFLADGAPNSLYLYQWKWSDQTKAQSAWGRWDFDGAVVGAEFISNKLYLIFQRSDGVYLELVDFLKLQDAGSTYITNLDRRVHPGSTSVSGGQTSFQLPYTATGLLVVTAVGRNLPVVSQTSNGDGTYTVVVSGTATTSDWVGIPYTFLYEFTPPFMKGRIMPGDAALPNYDGRLQIGTFRIRYNETGYFQATVQPDPVNTYTVVFTGRITSSQNNILGSSPVESGTLTLPVRALNEGLVIRLQSSSYKPCAFISAEWTGQFTPRSRRV